MPAMAAVAGANAVDEVPEEMLLHQRARECGLRIGVKNGFVNFETMEEPQVRRRRCESCPPSIRLELRQPTAHEHDLMRSRHGAHTDWSDDTQTLEDMASITCGSLPESNDDSQTTAQRSKVERGLRTEGSCSEADGAASESGGTAGSASTIGDIDMTSLTSNSLPDSGAQPPAETLAAAPEVHIDACVEDTSHTPPPASGGPDLHSCGKCTPCFYFLHGLCEFGEECRYCHLSHDTIQWKRPRPPKHVRQRMKAAGVPIVLAATRADEAPPSRRAEELSPSEGPPQPARA